MQMRHSEFKNILREKLQNLQDNANGEDNVELDNIKIKSEAADENKKLSEFLEKT